MTLKELYETHKKFCIEKGLPISKQSLDFLIDRIVDEWRELVTAKTLKQKREEAVDVLLQSIQVLIALDADIEKEVKKKMNKNNKREFKI